MKTKHTHMITHWLKTPATEKSMRTERNEQNKIVIL